MSYSYAGDDTSFPATADLLENGDVWNEVTATQGMIEPLFDRTAYLQRVTEEQRPWARIRCTGGVLTVIGGSGIDSVSAISGSVTEVTLTEALPNTNYGGHVTGWHTTVATACVGTIEPMTTTTFRVRIFEMDGTIIDQGTDTAQYTVSILG